MRSIPRRETPVVVGVRAQRTKLAEDARHGSSFQSKASRRETCSTEVVAPGPCLRGRSRARWRLAGHIDWRRVVDTSSAGLWHTDRGEGSLPPSTPAGRWTNIADPIRLRIMHSSNMVARLMTSSTCAGRRRNHLHTPARAGLSASTPSADLWRPCI
jgi:hypothetical protein